MNIADDELMLCDLDQVSDMISESNSNDTSTDDEQFEDNQPDNTDPDNRDFIKLAESATQLAKCRADQWRANGIERMFPSKLCSGKVEDWLNKHSILSMTQSNSTEAHHHHHQKQEEFVQQKTTNKKLSKKNVRGEIRTQITTVTYKRVCLLSSSNQISSVSSSDLNAIGLSPSAAAAAAAAQSSDNSDVFLQPLQEKKKKHKQKSKCTNELSSAAAAAAAQISDRSDVSLPPIQEKKKKYNQKDNNVVSERTTQKKPQSDDEMSDSLKSVSNKPIKLPSPSAPEPATNKTNDKPVTAAKAKRGKNKPKPVDDCASTLSDEQVKKTNKPKRDDDNDDAEGSLTRTKQPPIVDNSFKNNKSNCAAEINVAKKTTAQKHRFEAVSTRSRSKQKPLDRKSIELMPPPPPPPPPAALSLPTTNKTKVPQQRPAEKKEVVSNKSSKSKKPNASNDSDAAAVEQQKSNSKNRKKQKRNQKTMSSSKENQPSAVEPTTPTAKQVGGPALAAKRFTIPLKKMNNQDLIEKYQEASSKVALKSPPHFVAPSSQPNHHPDAVQQGDGPKSSTTAAADSNNRLQLSAISTASNSSNNGSRMNYSRIIYSPSKSDLMVPLANSTFKLSGNEIADMLGVDAVNRRKLFGCRLNVNYILDRNAQYRLVHDNNSDSDDSDTDILDTIPGRVRIVKIEKP